MNARLSLFIALAVAPVAGGSLAVVLASGLDAAATQAIDLSGKVTLGGEQVTLAPAVGLWVEGANRVSAALYAKPLSPAEEAAARAAGQWPVPATGPAVIADFEFKPGTVLAKAEDLVSCRVVFHNFRTRLELKGGAADCHAPYVGGMLQRQHGMFAGTIIAEEKGYTLHLPIGFQFPQAAATVTAATAGRNVATVPAVPAIPANTATGTVSFDGETLAVSHGVAWHEAEADDESILLALFDRAPTPAAVTALRKGQGSSDAGRVVAMTLYFKKGAPVAPASVTYCFVNGFFDKGGSIGKNANSAEDCGLTVAAGEAKPGGTIAVRLKGQDTGPRDKPWTWDLQINLPVEK